MMPAREQAQQERDRERMEPGPLLAELRTAGADVTRPTAIRCPYHEDTHASAGIYEDAGVWRFKCQSTSCGVGGDVYDLRALNTGKSIGDVLPRGNTDPIPIDRKQPRRTWPTLEALALSIPDAAAPFRYCHPDTGAVELAVFRIPLPDGGKKFLQASPVREGWAMTAPPKPWPLYNRKRVRAAESVVVVEGEKCVHGLDRFGIVATTSPAGAGKAALADWSPLAGKTVLLWPDADPPNPAATPDGRPHPKPGARTGIDHMREVARLLERLTPAPRLLWIDPDSLSLPPKGDAVDFLDAAEHPREELQGVIDNAEPMGAAGEIDKLIEDTIAGRRRNLSTPWGALGRGTNLFLPATLTVLGGNPGNSKSFLAVQLFAYLHESGVPVDLFMLEDDRVTHLMRALVQRCGHSGLLDDGWIRENGDEARRLKDAHRDWSDDFGRRLHHLEDQSVTHDDLLAWMRQRCAAGAQVIGIDPVTAIQGTDKPWLDDLRFITETRRLVRESGARVVFVTHPQKNTKGAVTTLGDLAGGAAYSRFTDTVLWLEKTPEPEEATLGTAFGRTTVTINRRIRVLKARKGKVAGLTFGMDFSDNNLSFSELGVVVK